MLRDVRLMDLPAIPPQLIPNTTPTMLRITLSMTTIAMLVKIRRPIRFNITYLFTLRPKNGLRLSGLNELILWELSELIVSRVNKV